MPYRPSDSTRFTKRANTPKKKRQWSKVYASARRRGASEGSAISQASGVIKKRGRKRKSTRS
jgi:hypothetical protein